MSELRKIKFTAPDGQQREWTLPPDRRAEIDEVRRKAANAADAADKAATKATEAKNTAEKAAEKAAGAAAEMHTHILCEHTGYPGQPTNLDGRFINDHYLMRVPPVDTSKATNMSRMFYGCYRLSEIRPDLDTSAATNLNGIFNSAAGFREIPALDTSKATNLNSFAAAFPTDDPVQAAAYERDCLESVGDLDTSAATNTGYMFCYRRFLKRYPALLDLRRSAYCHGMFAENLCLTDDNMPQILWPEGPFVARQMFYSTAIATMPNGGDFHNATEAYLMFNECHNLVNIGDVDFSSATQVWKWLADVPVEEIGTVTLNPTPGGITDGPDYWEGAFPQDCAKLHTITIRNFGTRVPPDGRKPSERCSGSRLWGTAGEASRQSVVDTLLTYSCDRVAAGIGPMSVRLSRATGDVLTEAEKAAITAKGYTLTIAF